MPAGTYGPLTLPADGEKIAAHENASGDAQQNVIIVLADGTLIPGDASGLKVQLGAALPAGSASIGTVILGAGAAEIGKLAAGSAQIGTVILGAGAAEIGKLAAGSALIGKATINDGTTDAEVTAAGTHKGLYIAALDAAGEPVSLLPPGTASLTPTISTSAYAAGDVFFAPTAFTAVVSDDGLTGHLYRITIVDHHDIGPDLDVYICTDSVSVASVNAAYAGLATSSDRLKVLEKFSIAAADWDDELDHKRITLGPGSGKLPLAYHCVADDLYIFAVVQSAPTYTATNQVGIEIQYQPD